MTKIKPSIFAFPLTLIWLSFVFFIMYSAPTSTTSPALILFFYIFSPVFLILFFATRGRSYFLAENMIIGFNHITRTRDVVYLSRINSIGAKPIVFGYGHLILRLAGGNEFLIKNIKLSDKKLSKYIDEYLKYVHKDLPNTVYH